ncbi:hypothetical protein N7468_004453 [Penicillium chermesinum]|uniref:RNA polymerase II holoenzyme cyclin-like subunit n=1 Tax=Penicillium chermesinum TaxID=63820 RepID=A0A9W9P8L5_9EURO|nr:uncharacterized protein N7468_004453 [Penicillium chermesinum]KAJ5239834.1 hypothetical protein N7468_004453 [Penicillium chermesinum]KAJ6166713.1 hypothetical protein N7470_002160 [Penicillium chermesinum]
MESTAPPAKKHLPGQPNPVVAEAEQKWLFTDDELERTPSHADKIDREKEDYIRHRSVEFIWQVSMMLKMPPQTSMTATIFMHRFLMRYSLRGHYPEQGGDLMHPKVIAAVALFVAFKVDETMRRMKDFIVACCRVAMKKADMVVDEQSKDYWRWRDLILQNESVMLEYLCFDLQLESPYRIVWEYACFLNVPDHRPLRNATQAFLNDSTYTVLCLQFPQRVIAAAALYAAARHCKVSFPDDDKGRPWWDQIDVRFEDITKACKLIIKIYERVQQNLSKGFPSFNAGDVVDLNDPTRLFHTNPASQDYHPSSHSSNLTPAPDSPAHNGRKRSREPDSLGPETSHASPAPLSHSHSHPSLNGGRSPKRQRTLSPTSNAGSSAPAPASQPRIPTRALGSVPSRPIPGSKPQDSNHENTPNQPKEEVSTEEGEVSDDKSVAAKPVDTKPADARPGGTEPVDNRPADPPARDDSHDNDGGGSEEGEI